MRSVSWQDWTAISDFLCSQEPKKRPKGIKDCCSLSKNRNFFFFYSVVWIKWMNIFRPAYFTPRHWREGGGKGRERGGGLISLSGQSAEWKESFR